MHPLPTLGADLSGKPEKEEKGYIPDQFPEFPSRHTFVSTPREEDQDQKGPKKAADDVSSAAKQGEDALRGLLRASKIRQQKEVRSRVETHDASKGRYNLWEQAMEKMMKGREETDTAADMPMTDRIADASMIVNSSAAFTRRDNARGSARGVRSGVGTEPLSR